MHLVVDTSVLVAECFRNRGQALLLYSALTLFQPDFAAAETHHELRRRADILLQRGVFSETQHRDFLERTSNLLAVRLHYVPASDYAPFEAVARCRIPRDPNDWTFVAAALHLSRLENTAILTLDSDFLGSGLPTWVDFN